ncbi:MAG: hypothetical protein Tsb002_15420 [Wenzhouxiangellaceae bacterium]
MTILQHTREQAHLRPETIGTEFEPPEPPNKQANHISDLRFNVFGAAKCRGRSEEE